MQTNEIINPQLSRKANQKFHELIARLYLLHYDELLERRKQRENTKKSA